MQPSPSPSPAPPLSAHVLAELARLEAALGRVADPMVRRTLAGLGEPGARRVLRKAAGTANVCNLSLSDLLTYYAQEELMQLNAVRIPAAESAAVFQASAEEASVSGPFYEEDVEMEVQSAFAETSVGLSNEGRIELVSAARQMPRPDQVAMEVERPSGRISPEFQNRSPFSASASHMANRGGAEARCLNHQMSRSSARELTPSPVGDVTKRAHQMVVPSGGLATAPSLVTVNALRARGTPLMLELERLDFDRIFLIYVYLAEDAHKKIEEELKDVHYIRYLKSLPMDGFESAIWNKFGHKYAAASDRRKNVDWDPKRTRVYHCNLEKRGDAIVTIFKGPFFENTRTHLQKIIGDEYVLIVKFGDIDVQRHMSATDILGIYWTFYNHVAQDGILLGLRRYKYFIHKDGGKEEKQKEAKKKEGNKKYSSSVRCHFVCTESGWDRDSRYILLNCTIGQARSLFMHIHTAPTLAKYLSRFSLILSKTIKLDVDLSEVHVKIIDDVPCRDESGRILGEDLIHTDGTGLISADLAMKCPVSVYKGLSLNDAVDSKAQKYLTDEHPLLMQIRMFYDGYVVKGTLLVDKTLPSKTIHIRPSMIKIKADPDFLGCKTFNSLEIVTTSNRPKRALTSKSLIALLHYGGVKEEFFVELLEKALEDVNKPRHKAIDSLEVAFNHADLDDGMSARMILSGIRPEDEAYLQSQLDLMTKEERKGLKYGKIPIPESFYLMGTADPTGTLKHNEVCVIHEHGQISGEVLVYKNPGLHFGDVHVLTAKYIDGLEDIVGNSKYAIFFPTSGPRSLPDEMANSDLDGDMYWISRNPQLLKAFSKHEPWVQRIPPKKTEQKKPQDYTADELERLLFHEFLKARFMPSYALSAAADCWLALMDRLLTCHVSESEKRLVKNQMLDLVDLYYLSLDAPKQGNEVIIPERLKVKLFPHYMERDKSRSHGSTSVLGKIYDLVNLHESSASPEIKVVALPCFANVTVRQDHKRRWIGLYQEYLRESTSLCSLVEKEEKNFKFRELYQHYKRILYEAEEYEQSPKERLDLFNEACAVYQVVYEHVVTCKEPKASKCGFAWKVAGRALCLLYALEHGGDTVLCSWPMLQDVFKKNRRAAPN